MDPDQNSTPYPEGATRLTENLLGSELRALYAESERLNMAQRVAERQREAIESRRIVIEGRLQAVLMLYRQASGAESEYEARVRLGLEGVWA